MSNDPASPLTLFVGLAGGIVASLAHHFTDTLGVFLTGAGAGTFLLTTITYLRDPSSDLKYAGIVGGIIGAIAGCAVLIIDALGGV